jgi:hypothetical protein
MGPGPMSLASSGEGMKAVERRSEDLGMAHGHYGILGGISAPTSSQYRPDDPLGLGDQGLHEVRGR